MDQTRFIELIKKVLKVNHKEICFGMEEERINEIAKIIYDALVVIEQPFIDEEDENGHFLITYYQDGKRASNSRKLANLILNWRIFLFDNAKHLAEALKSDIDQATLAFLALQFAFELYSHTTIIISPEHGLIYWALWKGQTTNRTIDAGTVPILITSLCKELGRSVPSSKRVEDIIKDLENLRTLKRLSNGDLYLRERLQIVITQISQ